MTPKHSAIGASSMYRWSQCPGSIRMSEGIHAPASKYAAEGTCAHELADACIRTGIDPDIYHGKTRSADNMDFVVDDEMVEGVRLYIEAGNELFDKAAGDVMHTERKFDLSHLYPGLYGTNDRVIWKPTQRRLIVDDFKYGKGIPVEVKGNKQLMYYGLGAVETLKLPVMEIWNRIIQPRCPHADGPIRVEKMNVLDLLDFKGELIQYAATHFGFEEDLMQRAGYADRERHVKARRDLIEQVYHTSRSSSWPAIPRSPWSCSISCATG